MGATSRGESTKAAAKKADLGDSFATTKSIIAPWAPQYARLTSQKLTPGQIQEFNAATKGKCVRTLKRDRCRPNPNGMDKDGFGCEMGGSTTVRSNCRRQPTARISTAGTTKIVSFSTLCTQGRSGTCWGAHSCTAGLLETVPVFLKPCATFRFTWKAVGGSDWAQVIIAIKKNNKIMRTEIYRVSRMTKYKTGQVWVSQVMGAGRYSVAFYTSSYDRSNGLALGAKLYVKPFYYQKFVRGSQPDGCNIPDPRIKERKDKKERAAKEKVKKEIQKKEQLAKERVVKEKIFKEKGEKKRVETENKKKVKEKKQKEKIEKEKDEKEAAKKLERKKKEEKAKENAAKEHASKEKYKKKLKADEKTKKDEVKAKKLAEKVRAEKLKQHEAE